MSYIATNLLPILAATLAGLVVGALYVVATRPEGVDRRWPVLAGVAALAEFWLASILAGALILAPVQVNPWVVALGRPVVIVTHLFRGLGVIASAGDAAHWLAAMVVQAAVLHLVGLVHP